MSPMLNKCLIWGPDKYGRYFAWRGDGVFLFLTSQLDNMLSMVATKGLEVVSPNSKTAKTIRLIIKVRSNV